LTCGISRCYDLSMGEQFPQNRRFKILCRGLIAVVLSGFLLAAQVQAQTEKPNLPNPVKFVAKYDVAWNVVRSVLIDMGYALQLEDRKGGKLTTKPMEIITGSLTYSETSKVAVIHEIQTGNWLRTQASAEAFVELVSPTETLVTVRTQFESLDREMDGTEKWVQLESLGTIERKILGKISMKLMGTDLDKNQKKGFWEKSPEPVDSRRERGLNQPGAF
jgi:hypothetical protein